MNDRKRWLNEERATMTRGFAAPFMLYTRPEYGYGWMAPILTLPGKPPHRICTGVVR